MTAKCCHCRIKPARKGSKFCTMKCAQDFAEERTMDYVRCTVCGAYATPSDTPGVCEECEYIIDNAAL